MMASTRASAVTLIWGQWRLARLTEKDSSKRGCLIVSINLHERENSMWKGNLLACGGNAKTVKGDGSEYLTAIMYLTPWKSAGINTCPMAEQAACIKGCLNKAGRGQMDSVTLGRARKTQWFASDRDGFMAQLVTDLSSFVRYCHKRGIQPCVRLNGTSDIRWELIKVTVNGVVYANVFDAFPCIQFYDYTKIANRKVDGIENYALTWSYSAANETYARQAEIALAKGMNIAVVFRTADAIPADFLGLPTFDGDKDDLRFLDPKGVVVALYAKGPAKRDYSGFVVG